VVLDSSHGKGHWNLVELFSVIALIVFSSSDTHNQILFIVRSFLFPSFYPMLGSRHTDVYIQSEFPRFALLHGYHEKLIGERY